MTSRSTAASDAGDEHGGTWSTRRTTTSSASATNVAALCLLVLVLVLLFFLAGGGRASPATDELRRVSSCAVAVGTGEPASPAGDEHGGTSPDLGARAARRGGAGPRAPPGMGEQRSEGEELDLARPTMGEARRG